MTLVDCPVSYCAWRDEHTLRDEHLSWHYNNPCRIWEPADSTPPAGMHARLHQPTGAIIMDLKQPDGSYRVFAQVARATWQEFPEGGRVPGCERPLGERGAWTQVG